MQLGAVQTRDPRTAWLAYRSMWVDAIFFGYRCVNPWFRDEMRKLMKIFTAKYNRWCHTKTVQSTSWLQNLLFELTGIKKKLWVLKWFRVLVKNNYPRIYYSEFNFAFSFTFWVDFVLSTTVQLLLYIIYYMSYTWNTINACEST